MHMEKLIYTAMSKRMFFCRDAVSAFVLGRDLVPLNPFRLFDYFLGDRVDRDAVRMANSRVLAVSHELWVFGSEIADGVFEEICLARQWGTPIRFFEIGSRVEEIVEIEMSAVTFEAELLASVDGDEAWLRAQLPERLARD